MATENNTPSLFFPEAFQFRAARALLKLGIRDVAAAIDASTATVQRLEKDGSTMHASTIKRAVEFYTEKGIKFTFSGLEFVSPTPTDEEVKEFLRKEVETERLLKEGKAFQTTPHPPLEEFEEAERRDKKRRARSITRPGPRK